MTTDPLNPQLPEATALFLDNLADTNTIMAHLAQVSAYMDRANARTIGASAEALNALMAENGPTLQAQLEAFAILGPALNSISAIRGEPPMLDVRPFAEKLADAGKGITESGLITEAPQPSIP